MKDRLVTLDDKEMIILYSIGSLDQPLRSKLKLQKILFLVTNVFDDLQDLLKFEPNLMGPYSERIDYVLQDFERMGLVEVQGSNYSLTKKGEEVYIHLKPKAELANVINDFKDFLNDLSDNEVMTFIYTFYPKYTSESTKWNELKEKRIDYATKLLIKGKVSFSKAAQIADMNALEFADSLRRGNIKWRIE
jgi:uncharacterized protein YwgA